MSQPDEGRPEALQAPPVDRNASFAANEALWDVWTAIHATGEFYDLEDFKAGGVRLRPYEIELVGDVSGKTLLHLQCHFGIDTLSWARLGARVTGADISGAAVELATDLATTSLASATISGVSAGAPIASRTEASLSLLRPAIAHFRLASPL